ncbi:MAG TPA: DUF3391 domain-containing protein, partial [Albitalea sp.]|nr:DUF3391 domain-containing protein [Albitalea sp.]
MKNTGTTAQIEVDALRVGMFVHLDAGWMSHPFPLSSFRITSAQQIAIIRKLGLKELRVDPTEPAPTASASAIPAEQPSPATEAQAAARAALRERREALTAQRASLAICERQFAEATRECRQLTDIVAGEPQIARDKAHALAHTMVGKMLGQHELCIR